jgi:hypothetical protein
MSGEGQMPQVTGFRRGLLVGLAAGALAIAMAGVAIPASAVNSPQTSVVSQNPADYTPQVMNGSVQGITQIGSKIVAVGTFTTVRQTLTSADITRHGIFAFDAATGAIDMGFDPNLGGNANSVDNDGTYIYVGGAFTSVGGSSATKRLAKLTAAGVNVPGLKVPNKAVNEVVVRGTRLYIGGAFTNVGGAGTPRTALAALDTASGAVLPDVNVSFTGLHHGGATNITRMDVTPDGSKLVAIGNFTTVGGLSREQIAIIDLAGTATVSSWHTSLYQGQCAGVFDTYMRDIDISPDGSYFVVTATGAYSGGPTTGTLCDTSTRWETGRTGEGQQPTWIDYTGGDTTYGVAITGSVIYVGGHMRWENNPFQGDQAGPGAVPREGIAALDPVNGLPLSWNPGRTRGVGAQALYATATGLWVGSDTDKIGKPRETHSRIAFMPLAGGTAIPQVNPTALPNDVFLAEPTSPGRLLRRSVNGSGAPTGAATVANSAMDWSLVRGAFLLTATRGTVTTTTVYYGLADGGLYARTFDKSTGVIGTQRTVNLYDDPDNGQRIPFAIPSLSGIFYDTATRRLYYTLTGDSHLYYRYFTPESEVVGAQTFTGSSSVDLSAVSGMTLAGGQVLYGSLIDGALRSVAFSNGQVTGSATPVSPDGTWKFRAIMASS